MQNIRGAVIGILILASAVQNGLAIEPTWNYAVQVSAAVQVSPPQITLTWPQDTTAVPASYTVQRKAPDATSWGATTTLAGSATSFADTTVTVGTAYEYRIVKNAGSYTGYGYIQTGVSAPLVDSRGKLVLIVDNTYAANLAPELARLQQDLAGDGWTILRHDVARNSSVTSVKNLIKADYNADPASVKSVFLFGHVPVPYSGQLNPDGHPDHVGAWPADVYYGDMDGNWTDSSVNYTQTVNTDPADAARLTNIPGDGKFDQTTIPSAIELQVGRVDLSNMPGRLVWGGPASFPSEQELLRQYLNKDHNFRHRLLSVQRRGIVGDYFGVRNGEAFAASGYRSFAPLVGPGNIANLNVAYNDMKGVWIPALATNDYLWAYGCGAGSYWTIGGLGSTGQYNDGSTTEVVNNNTRAVFTLLFGSWLGDWDHEDDILRSILATKDYGLTAAWSGRPHWFTHPMGLGETIGYCARLVQNNTGLYQNQINSSANLIHIALMGDPTLRMHPVVPPSTLSGLVSAGVSLTWLPSSDSVVGYHVYRGPGQFGPFTRLTSSLVTATTFLDLGAPAGTNTYMVRAVKLENTPSGSYYNASQGAFWTVGGVSLPATDTTAPVVSVSAPANNATVSGSSVTLSASASDNVGVVGVQFKLDGVNLGSEDLLTPFGLTWDTTSAANGPHTISAVARDLAGNQTTATTISVNVSNAAAATVVWFDDALPANAGPGAGGGDAWTWVNSNPTPFSGILAHQSTLGAGLHEHYFNWATATLTINTGDVLFAYVYLDPVNPPSELMLSWNADNWEHRAYWGGNSITYGTDGTAGRRYVGSLPAVGQWVRLEVAASQVGLEGQTLTGMGFSLFGGRATWDYTGKSTQSSPPLALPAVTVVATDASAAEAGMNPGVFTITRSGATTVPLVVSYSLGGTASNGSDYNSLGSSVTIPAGAASATVTVTPVDDAVVEGDETVVLTLAASAAYTVGSSSSATVTIADNDSPAIVTVVASDATATIGGSDNGAFTFTRSGGTSGDLLVNYTLGGSAIKWNDYRRVEGDMPVSVTIPSGSASTTMTIMTVTNSMNANPQTVVLTLSSDAAYTVGTQNTATLSILVGSSSTTNPPPVVTNQPPTLSAVEYSTLALPMPGDSSLNILSPTLLELHRINTKQADPARVDSWDFINTSGLFVAPAVGQFVVTADGVPVVVQSIGFKRRPLYAPLAQRDLRIDNCLYLQLATPIADNQSVAVLNPGSLLWATNQTYSAKADPLRYSPAIHVNQEGYVPTMPKKAMIGYYLGSLGEMNVTASSGFKIVDAVTGNPVYQGNLTARADVGYVYTATPYQKVLEADFTSFATPGEYRLMVPGLGASLPFLIDDGVAMAFTRTYALGLYHQRCGTNNALPFTRFIHDACHIGMVEVPSPQSSYAFTWTTIASKNSDFASNPRHTAPQLKDEVSQLYPFVNKGVVSVAGGHHDAGDYSRYTINSAGLVHHLMFTADSIAGAAALDNLGLPESGDGISDLMQEAKQEADYIARLQDADGGFYFIVYPKTREYEGNVLPDHGDSQVVWPKNTAATAASVAALAQCASSPMFKQRYPVEAAVYLQKAKAGWQFLTNAIARCGKDGSYQKITFYGDHYMHDDELAWAACEMYVATGDAQYQQKLFEWFPNPADPATFMWGWWRMSESWGRAIRSYAFAARSGRLSAGQLNATYLAQCETQIKAAGDDALNWSTQSAYGSAFPDATKRVMSAGWYFSLDQAADMAVAYQLNPRPEYLTALVGNMNYEGGCNPVNVTYVTGLGWKRQREIVHQYAQNDRRVLPPDGIPLGNIQASFDYLWDYGSELGNLTFPSDSTAASPYPFYDRWADAYNVTTEFVALNQARSMMALAMLSAQTSAKSTAWTSGSAQITVPGTVVPVDEPVTLSAQTPGLDLNGARVVWEARDQEPAYGSTYTISPKNNGPQWVEVEVQWPDGRRVFGTNIFVANSPVVTWVDETLPAGAQAAAEGGDGWTWITGNPAAFSGTKAHQSNLAAGTHGHYFDNATATLEIGTGDTMFAYVYLDPANPPTEVMLMWNDGTWEHRAYWGANSITYGLNGTASRISVGALPASGQWVRLQVPANQVGLEGSIVKGMAFYAYGGLAIWDTTGKTSATNSTPADSTAPSVSITAPVASSVVSGSSVTVSASATDNVGVAGVQFKLDGGNLGSEDLIAPFSVTLNSTLITDGAHNLTAVARDAAGNQATSTTVTIVVSNTVPTLPAVTITATDASAAEAGLNTGLFTVTRLGTTGTALTVNYTVSGTASSGADYNALGASVVIPAGSASATIMVTPVDDSFVESSETVVLTLSSSAAYTVGSPSSATVTIADNDVAAVLPTVSVSATDASGSRVGPDTGTFTVSRTGSTTAALTVNYSLTGTATNGLDYNTLSTSVTIPAGAASVPITVTPKASTNLVNAVTVSLTLSTNSAYTVGSGFNATIIVAGNSVPISSINKVGNKMRLTWVSVIGKTYRVAYKDSLTATSWTNLSGTITATSTTTTWNDTTADAFGQRFYNVYMTN